VAVGTSSLVGEAADCAGSYSMVASSDGLEPLTALESKFEVALQVHSFSHTCVSSNIMEKTAIFFLLTSRSSSATLKIPCAWHTQPPPLLAPGRHTPTRRWPMQRVDLQRAVGWALGPPQGAYAACRPGLGHLLFLLIVIKDSKQPMTLWCSGTRSRALAG
jgi:hypothetical protein